MEKSGALLQPIAVLVLFAASACGTVQEQPSASLPPSASTTLPQMVAAPPAPPEAKQPRSFLVFFGSNGATLGADARHVIGEAVDEYRQFAPVRVIVLGHADLSGSPRRNRALSERRAKAVLDALVKAGVPQDRITAGAFGESQPAFMTPDGAAEPQNRRVEIYLR